MNLKTCSYLEQLSETRLVALLYRDNLKQKHAQRQNFSLRLQDQVQEQKQLADALDTQELKTPVLPVNKVVADYIIKACSILGKWSVKGVGSLCGLPARSSHPSTGTGRPERKHRLFSQ